MIAYPKTLPAPIIGKSRTEKQGINFTDPFTAALQSEVRTYDLPVVWDVTFQCGGQFQPRQMQAFIRQVSGGKPFCMDILTEFGFEPYEVRFINAPYDPEQIQGGVWRYSGTIEARSMSDG